VVAPPFGDVQVAGVFDGGVPGPHLDRLAPARHTGHAGPGVPDGLRRRSRAAPTRRSLAPRPPRRPIPLTAAEIRRLFSALVITPLHTRLRTPARVTSDIQHWSSWRRHHQGRARRSHYQRRLAAELSP
jgi:hypothetical protein